MRIISGSFRGKKINAPSNLPVRPTTDFAKEALFNVLNNHYDFDSISVLDLFSGIGSISLEFASRGSTRIVSVDIDPGCVRFLSDTVKKMNLENIITVIRSDVFEFLKHQNSGFDVVYADPPYDFEQQDYDRIIGLVRENGFLSPEGELIVEHPKNISFKEHPNLAQTRKYGRVHFSFFEFES